MTTIILLTISNIFMTIAWYGHLKYRNSPLWLAILVSWLIASLEYCFQVPANRIGYGQFTGAQLKTIQEVITLIIFAIFSVVYLKEPLKMELPRRLRIHGHGRLLRLQEILVRPNFVDFSDGFDFILGKGMFFGGEAFGGGVVDLGDDALGQGFADGFDGGQMFGSGGF